MTIIFLGCMILAIVTLQNYLYRRFWDRGLVIKIKFSAKEAFEGESLYLTEELTNNKLLPLPWLFLSFRMSEHLVENESQNELFSLMMHQYVSRQLSFVCGKRGVYSFRNVNLTASNLLHTEQFKKNIKIVNQLVVFPKLLESPELGIINKQLDTAILSTQLINPDPFEFRGIREYQSTDPVRSINFKATAVAGELMVNIHAPTSSKRLNIILNLEPYNTYPNQELYEQAIRLTASIAGRYINENVNVAFATNGRDITSREEISLGAGGSTSHLYNVYESLARIDLTQSVTPISEYIDKILDHEAVYLVISTYHQAGLLDAIERLRGSGVSAFLVVPVFNSMKVKLEPEYASIWEAGNDCQI